MSGALLGATALSPAVANGAGTGSIDLTVTDSATTDPLAGATVTFFGDGVVADESGTTDGQGEISFGGLPSGVFQISVDVAGYVSQSPSVSVIDGEPTAVGIALVPANATVAGTVEDSEGQPLETIFVYVRDDDGGPNLGSDVTSVGGTYEIDGLGAGNVSVFAGGPGTGWNEVEIPTTLIANETVVVDFELTPRIAGAVAGGVIDTSEIGIADICGEVYDVATGEVVAGFFPTDASGQFFADDIAVGDYTLLFYDCNFLRAPAFTTIFLGDAVSVAGATSFSITDGDTTDLGEITLQRGATISGTARLRAGDESIPMPANRGVDAIVWALDGGVWTQFPDPSPFVGDGGPGQYQVSGLPEGTYRVAIGDPATGVKAYTRVYWQGVVDFDDATNIVVTGTTPITGIDAIVEVARPGYQPTPISTASLTADVAGDVSTPDDTITQNETTEVEVGDELAGEWVSVWGHSTPVQMGDWVQVDANGTVTVPVPSTLPPGAHQLAAQDAEGTLIGWTDVAVSAAAPSDAELVATGVDGSSSLLGGTVGAALLLLGAGLLVARTRLVRGFLAR